MLIQSRLRRLAAVAGLLGVLGAASGCGATSPAPPPSGSEATLRIAAATDLQKVLPRLIEAFEAAGGGGAATPSFGASGNLAEQIRQGAPFDLFLSADMAFPLGLGDEGILAPGSIQPYARGALALVVHPAAADLIDELADLAKPEVGKVAIANPRFAPYGRAARETLDRAGLWSKVEAKIVLAESARQALVHVERGDADAALISRSLLDPSGDDKVIQIAPKLHSPIIQGLGIVARSQSPAEARAFVDFLLGNRGRLILEEAGFEPPEAADGADSEPR